jgi:hypothetical protein
VDAFPADEGDGCRSEQRAGLRGHRLEHFGLGAARRDQGRDAPERRLLRDERRRLAAGFGVDDRLSNEGCKVAQLVLGVGWKRIAGLRPRRGHDTPHLAVDGDRRADRGLKAEVRPELLGKLRLQVGGGVHASRSRSFDDPRRDRVAAVGEDEAGRRILAALGAPAADHPDRVAVPAHRVRPVRSEEPAVLGRDGSGELALGRACGDERCDPAQCGLLLGDSLEL